MRIVIEVAPQIPRRGIGVYTENLIKGLAKIDKENEYILFSWFFKNYEEKIRMLYCPEQENFSLLAKKFPDSLLSILEWKLGLPVVYNFLKNKKIDIYHSPAPRLPKLDNKVKKIITVHDLIYEIYSNWVNTEFIKANREAVKNADIIITNSENTKNDLLKHYTLDKNKVVVIHPGINLSVYKLITDKTYLQKVVEKYYLPEKFILSVGPFNPHKNHLTLLNAYKLFLDRYKRYEYKLLLVGERSYQYERLVRTVKELNIEENVIFIDYIPQDDLVAIYNLADLLVCLSLYEGFSSYVVLEAMACGCVVITSNVSSFPEAVGDSGVLVDPLNISQICEAINLVLTDKNLKEKLRQKVLKRVQQFSYENFAKKILNIYQGIFEK